MAIPCLAALVGATALLLSSRVDIIEILEKKIEWPTLIFFTALFIVVAVAEESGLIHFIADWVKTLSGESTTRAVLLILWISAFASALMTIFRLWPPCCRWWAICLRY